MIEGYKCRIWETLTGQANVATEVESTIVSDSRRADGGYEITLEAEASLRRLETIAKARLTTWLVDQHLLGIRTPVVTKDIVDKIVHARSLSVADRSVRLLLLLAARSPRIDQVVILPNDSVRVRNLEIMNSQIQELLVYWEALAWSESTELGEIHYLTKYLEKQGWIECARVQLFDHVIVTLDGYARIQEMQAAVDSRQAFVAMWLDNEMDIAYGEGIKPGIENAGYAPMRIDGLEHVGKIDDRIIAEIRRSKFLVADFSQGKCGARGGVYFEAGFALGLNIPVIYTCRSSDRRRFTSTPGNTTTFSGSRPESCGRR